MSVGKILFKGIDSTSNIQEVKKEEVKPSPSTEENKEKSNATKYMIGATALAATIAVGIIGHKNNWWRKAADAADDLSKKGAKTLDNAENKASEMADDLSKKGSESIDNVEKNISEITSQNPKTIQDIDYSDFSKIEGEIYEEKGFKCKDIKNSDGKLVRTFVSEDGKTLSAIIDYDLVSGNKTKATGFLPDGKTLNSIIDFNKSTGLPLKMRIYEEDGKTLYSIIDCDPLTGKQLKSTIYNGDGKTITSVMDYELSTGNTLKITNYKEDGKTFKSIIDCDPDTGNWLKMSLFEEDGKTVKSMSEYDIDGKVVKTTYYKPDGTIDRVIGDL